MESRREKKPVLLFAKEWYEYAKRLRSEADRWKFIDAILGYHYCGELPSEKDMDFRDLAYIEEGIIPKIDENVEKYKATCEKRSIYGRKGAEARYKNTNNCESQSGNGMANANENMANANENMANANENMANANENMANANKYNNNNNCNCNYNVNTLKCNDKEKSFFSKKEKSFDSFVPPTEGEVIVYAKSKGIDEACAIGFYNHNEANGWHGIKKWQPWLENWATNAQQQKASKTKERIKAEYEISQEEREQAKIGQSSDKPIGKKGHDAYLEQLKLAHMGDDIARAENPNWEDACKKNHIAELIAKNLI